MIQDNLNQIQKELNALTSETRDELMVRCVKAKLNKGYEMYQDVLMSVLNNLTEEQQLSLLRRTSIYGRV